MKEEKYWKKCNNECRLIERKRVFFFLIYFFKDMEKKSLKRK